MVGVTGRTRDFGDGELTLSQGWREPAFGWLLLWISLFGVFGWPPTFGKGVAGPWHIFEGALFVGRYVNTGLCSNNHVLQCLCNHVCCQLARCPREQTGLRNQDLGNF